MRFETLHRITGYAVAALVVLQADVGAAQDLCSAPRASSSSESAELPLDSAPALLLIREAYVAANDLRTGIGAPREEFGLLLEAALESIDEGMEKDHRGTTLLHIARSLVLRLEGLGPESAEARLLARRAAELLAQVASLAQSIGSPRMRSFAEGFRAEIYQRSGREEEALILNEFALLAAVESDDAGLVARWSTERGRLLDRLGREKASLVAYRLAREAVDRLRGHVPPRDFVAVASPAIHGLVDLLLRESDDTSDSQKRRVEAIDALEDLNADQIRDFFDDPCLIGSTPSSSPDYTDAAVVYPILLDNRAELLIARSDRVSRILLDEKPGALEALARRFADQLRDRTSSRYRRSARRLYEIMIEPAKDVLLESGSTIVFVPPRALLGVPFAALQDPDTKEFLVQKRPIAVTPSFRLSEPRPINREEMIGLVAGLTDPAPGFDPLPFVSEEVASVVEAFPSRTLVGRDFTAERIEASLRAAPVGLLHIASHAVFEEQVSRSFIVTSNGRILLDDFASLIAKTRFRADRPLELLTLSACESARGNEEALLGLAGVAIRSGARSALGTLWPVQDEATALAMRHFYHELARPGVSRAEALRRAQSAMIADDLFGHPVFWAPFQLLNDWR
jgi:CHAT domain-containing protein